MKSPRRPLVRPLAVALLLLAACVLAAPPAAADESGKSTKEDAATERARKHAIRGLRSKIRKLARSPWAHKKVPELTEALEALATLGGREAGHAALGALYHTDTKVRDMAFDIIEREHHESLTRPLAELLENKDLRRDADVRKRVAHALAVMADPDAIEPLSTLIAFDEDAEVVAQAAEALADYASVPVKKRKLAVRRLVDLYTSVWNLKESVRTEPRDKMLRKEAEERYQVYGKSLRFALQALTGVQLTRPHEWRQWWNDNKKRSKWGRESIMPDDDGRRR